MQIETDRLILRPMEIEDLDDFAALNQDPLVMQHFPRLATRARSEEIILIYKQAWSQDEFSFSAVISKTSGAFLGMAGLAKFDQAVAFAPTVEIGWRLFPSAWGQGLASEAARGWLDYGFRAKGLEEIVSFTALPNVRSEKVMQRIGMQRHTPYDFDMPTIPEGHVLRPHLVYRLTAERYFMDESR